MTVSRTAPTPKAEGKIYESPHPEMTNEIDQFSSLGHLVIQQLSDKIGDKKIFIDVASGRHWTGSELKTKILNVATALRDELGFQPGSVACVSYDHSDMTCILALAIICAGGTLACAFPMDPYAELLYLARKVRPKILFCHAKNAHWAKQLEEDLNYPVPAVIMDDEKNPIESFAELRGESRGFKSLFDYDYTKSKSFGCIPHACANPAMETAVVTMSSGTTGKPKAVPMTHRALISMIYTFLKKSAPLNFGCSASLDYVSGQLIILGAVCVGYCAIIMDGFDPLTYLKAIEDYKINVVYLGAASFYSLISHPDADKYDLSSLLFVFPMGAKVIYNEDLRKFFKKWPNIKMVRQAFGTSETMGVTSRDSTPEEYVKDSDNCGHLVTGVRGKVVDQKTGQLLGPNQQGVFHIQGPTVFPGYYDASRLDQLSGNAADDPASAILRDSTHFDDDGFFITGDIVYFNENEELYVIGREKECMSCRGAKKVLPQELEEVIGEHPAVSKVCVFGVPNKRELTLHCPRAFIVPYKNCYDDVDEFMLSLMQRDRKDCNVNQTNDAKQEKLEFIGKNKLCSLADESRRALSEDIMAFVNERVGWEKQITGGIVILDDIPTLRATGKMNKTYLRSLSEEQVEIYGDRSR